MGRQELLQTMPSFRDEVLFKKMRKGWILLWFGHVRHGKEYKLFFVKLHLWSSGFQIFFESHGAIIIKGVLSSEMRMDVIDAEIDLKVKLQLP